MSREGSRTALQAFLGILGSVMSVAGAATVVLGVDSVVGAETVFPTVDSEMRFYAVWYVGAGVLVLRSVPRVESASTVVRGVGLLFFVAGCARALSWLTVGEPHAGAQVLMVIELALPFVIVPWQAAVSRPTPTRPRSGTS